MISSMVLLIQSFAQKDRDSRIERLDHDPTSLLYLPFEQRCVIEKNSRERIPSQGDHYSSSQMEDVRFNSSRPVSRRAIVQPATIQFATSSLEPATTTSTLPRRVGCHIRVSGCCLRWTSGNWQKIIGGMGTGCWIRCVLQVGNDNDITRNPPVLVQGRAHGIYSRNS